MTESVLENLKISAAELTLDSYLNRQVELTKAPTVKYANTSKPKQPSEYQGKFHY